jgi:hypothetical protein
MRPEDRESDYDKYSYCSTSQIATAHTVSHLEFLPDVQEEIDG